MEKMQKNMSHFADFRPVWRGERAHLPLSRSEGLRHGFYIGGQVQWLKSVTGEGKGVETGRYGCMSFFYRTLVVDSS